MGKPAARLGDTTMHGSPLLGAPCPTVLIGGKPAWRIGDQHTCPIPNAPPPACTGTPHGPGVTTPVPDGGSGVTLIGGKPAARMGDIVMEPGALIPLPPPNTIVMGCPTVLISIMGASAGSGGVDPNICQTEGHPVDVVTGKVMQLTIDINRPSPARFQFRRFYSTAMTVTGDLGAGWRHCFEFSLVQTAAGYQFTDETGNSLPLPEIAVGQTVQHGGMRLQSIAADELIIWRGPNDGLQFRRQPGQRYQLTRIHDGPDRGLDFTYRPAEQLMVIQDACGRCFEFQYTGQRLMQITERSCQSSHISRIVMTYTYDRSGHLVAAQDACGGVLGYVYDQGLLIEECTATGFRFYFQYDSRKRCLTTWGDGNLLYRKFDYNDHDQITRVTDSRGATRLYFHRDGLVYRLTHGDGTSKSFLYDDRGNLNTVLDETGIGAFAEFDSAGNTRKRLTPTGGSVEFSYDALGRLITTRNSLGAESHSHYDAAGHLVGLSEGETELCCWRYNSRGDVDRIEDAAGYRVDYRYDAYGRVESLVDSEGSAVRLAYDEFSNIREVADETGKLTTCLYDACNRIVERREADGNVTYYAWHANGTLKSIQQPDGGESSFEYYWTMRTATHQRLGSTFLSTRFHYDTEQNLTEIELPNGEAYRFSWNLRNQLICSQDPGGRSTHFHYDPAGRLLEERGGDVQVNYEYDGSGNLAAMEGSDGERVAYEYGPFGAIVAGQAGEHRNQLIYNEYGHLVQELADGEQLTYQYDRYGRRTAIRPSRGAAVEFQYLPAGPLQRVNVGGRKLVEFHRDRRGRIVNSQFANGIQEEAQWDSRDRLSTLSLTHDGHCLRRQQFSYDALSQLTSLLDRDLGATEFRYHASGAVSAQRLPGQRSWELYAIDKQDNALELPGGRTAQYGSGDELLKVGEQTLAYDAGGRLISSTDPAGLVTRYHYNFRGLLTRVEHPQGEITTYEYDAFGRRVKKIDRGQPTVYLWDGDQLLASWTDSAETRQFVLDPHRWRPLAQIDWSADAHPTPRQQLFCHTDHLGAVTSLTNERGQIKWSVLYDCQGDTVQIEGAPTATILRRPGQYFDAETGYYYNRYRYYAPKHGQFTTPDPTHIQGGLNLYRFPGNLVNTLDLLGLSPTALVDNNFLVSLFESDKFGLKTPADINIARGKNLGMSPTAYKEFTQGEGINGRERKQREAMLKRYGIEQVLVCGAREQAAFQQAKDSYIRQGLSENDATIAAHAKAKNLPLLSADQRAYVNNNAFARNSVQSLTNMGADSRGAPVFQIVLR